MEFKDEPEFDFGSLEYRIFFSEFGLTPFQHPDWLQPLYRRLPAPAGWTPLILVGRQTGTGRLCAVFPLLVDRKTAKCRVSFSFLEVTDYACPVIDPAIRGHISLREVLEGILGDYVLDIKPIHSDHRDLWSELLGCSPGELDFGSHALGVSAPGDRVFGKGKSRTMNGLRRKGRRLGELGDVRLEVVTGADAADSIQMAGRFRAGRFCGDPLQTGASAAFYADVAASAGGLSRTYRLVCNDQVIAILFGLVHFRRFCYLILACDYAHYAKYSPGLMMIDLVIQAWAGAGGKVFDFTIGDEPFKARFGCGRTPMYSIASS